MELAVPIIALGGLYIASNQEDKKEPYVNMKNSEERAQQAPINYPKLAPVKNTNPNKYRNPNTVTDRYFNPKIYEEYANGPDQFNNMSKTNEIVGLTGEPISKENFKHNNMAPFFGAKIRGSTQNPNVSETVLDNMNGNGSQFIKKQEQAPLFAPQKEIRHANGVPNNNDFYQSRVNPGQKMSNVKMWDEQKVGPGLDAGYTTDGQLGFNSGMAAREKWVGKNVDELRVKTNPKLTFGLQNHEGPAHYFINKPATVQTQGKVEKYLPDTYYLNTPDRWFTTTGMEKAQTARAVSINKPVNRQTTTVEYFGTDSNPEGTKLYIPGEYEQSKRNPSKTKPIINPKIKSGPSTGDYGSDGYKLLPNNRSTTNYSDFTGIHGILKATIAPILDVLRPTRKENVIGNPNPTGNVQVSVEAPPTFNPADRAPTTIRETTEGKLGTNHLNVEGQNDGGYLVSEQQSVEQERDTTNVSYYGDGGNNTGAAVYNAAYNQRNNVNKTYKNRPHQGGMALHNPKTHVQIDKLEEDVLNTRAPIRNSGMNSAIPTMETYGKINVPQYYDNCMPCDRINPDILTAFKENPYTQSLNSY